MQRHDVASTLMRRCINVMCPLGIHRGSTLAMEPQRTFAIEPQHTFAIEPEREKTYLLKCAPNNDKSVCPSTQSDQSLLSPHEETLHPWLSKMRPGKILISLCECAG